MRTDKSPLRRHKYERDNKWLSGEIWNDDKHRQVLQRTFRGQLEWSKALKALMNLVFLVPEVKDLY